MKLSFEMLTDKKMVFVYLCFFFRLKRMETVLQLCDAHIAVDNFNIGTNFTNSEFFNVLNEIAPTYNDTMFFCKWRNEANFCNEYFRTTITEEGVCYTYNALNSHEIYTDE